MEEDLNVSEDGQVNEGKAGKKDIPQTTVKQRGEEEGKKKRRSRKSMGLNGKAM